MPGRWLGLVGAAAVALLGSGCGTLVNVTSYAPPEMGEGQRHIYGGVVWDLKGEYRALTTPFPNYFLGIHLPMILAYLIDTPLSALGDTITLPITICEALGFSFPPWPPLPEPPPGQLLPTVMPVSELPPPRAVGPVAPEPPK